MSKKVWAVNAGDTEKIWVCESKKDAQKLCDKLNDHMWVRGISRDAEVIKYKLITHEDIVFDKYVRFAVPIEPWLIHDKEHADPINFVIGSLNVSKLDADIPEITHLEYDLLSPDYSQPNLVFGMAITDHLIKSEDPATIVRNKFKKVLAQMKKSLKDRTIEGIKDMPEKDKIHVPHSLIVSGKLLVFTTDRSKQKWMDLNNYTIEDEDDWDYSSPL